MREIEIELEFLSHLLPFKLASRGIFPLKIFYYKHFFSKKKFLLELIENEDKKS